MEITQTWDKTFKKSPKVDHKKITFHNRYGITLVADEYTPKNKQTKLPAIAISGPFGAVKEQASGLYAQTLAEKGYLTIAFDPSYTGESSGTPRYMASPDINTEDFQAAIDYLTTHEKVDKNKIAILGICGWGGLALNTACLDTRIKATITSTMYNMSRLNANGYFDQDNNEEKRFKLKENLNNQRTEDYQNGYYKRAGGVIDPLPKDAPQFVKDYHDYYKTKRGYHKRSLNSNEGWNLVGCMSYINQPIINYSNEIKSAVLMIHGEKAHSKYFTEDEYKKMTKDSKYKENKELLIIPNAVHTDLYDKKIPFDKIDEFLKKYMN